MAIYFLRHGESEANVKGLFAGQRENSPLTKKGINQARLVADQVKTLDIDRIITSPLLRARQTADEVANVIGFDIARIEVDDRLSEYDMGALTGTPIRVVTSEELVNSEGAEDPILFRQRVVNALRKMVTQPGNTLVVSHAGVGRMIESTKEKLSPALFYNLKPYQNGVVHRLDLDWMDTIKV